MVALLKAKRTSRKLVDLRIARRELDLRRSFRQHMLQQQRRRVLAAAGHLENERLIDRLIEAGFTEATLPAIALAPVAAAAWGSGQVTRDERLEAVETVLSSDLLRSIDSVDLFRSWLARKPSSDLLLLWEDYTREQLKDWSESERESMGRELLEHATRVALASGGFLGIGKICAGEQEVLDTIRRVYELTD